MIKPLTVSQLIDDIKRNLESSFFNITVEGEVSNLSQSATGHWYFSLSDENSLVSCALFKTDALRNSQIRQLKDGDKIFCTGTISVYPKRGTFQLIVKKIFKSGAGDLKEQFELLKEKLRSEGLFDLSRKKLIPQYPERVALITATESAAAADFMEVLFRRTCKIELVLVPSLVQGDAAPQALIKAFKNACKLKGIDAIIFARGGGSMEDLWAFNHEELVRLVAQSEIPTISAIGHQIDFTLLDFVADKRAETPTASAELISQGYLDIKQNLSFLKEQMLNLTRVRFLKLDQRVEKISPPKFLEKILNRLNNYQKRISKLNLKDRQYEILRFPERYFKLDDLVQTMKNSIEMRLVSYRNRMEESQKLLVVMNPKQVLDRGFAIISSKEKIIVSKEQLIKNNSKVIEIQFKDGTIHADINY